jgi:hypothetical protein
MRRLSTSRRSAADVICAEAARQHRAGSGTEEDQSRLAEAVYQGEIFPTRRQVAQGAIQGAKCRSLGSRVLRSRVGPSIQGDRVAPSGSASGILLDFGLQSGPRRSHNGLRGRYPIAFLCDGRVDSGGAHALLENFPRGRIVRRLRDCTKCCVAIRCPVIGAWSRRRLCAAIWYSNGQRRPSPRGSGA